MPGSTKILKGATAVAFSLLCGLLLFEVAEGVSILSFGVARSAVVSVALAALAVTLGGWLLTRGFVLRSSSESLLDESDRRFRAIAGAASDAVIVGNREHRIVFCNAAAERVFGYSAGEMLGESIGLLVPPKHRARYLQTAQQLVQEHAEPGEKTVQAIGMRKNGSLFSMEITLSVGVARAGSVLTGVVRDVSDRRRAENALRQQAATMRAITEGTIDAVWVKGLDGCYTLVNSNAAHAFGRARSEIIGRNDTDLFDPPMAAEIAERDREALESNRPVSHETTYTGPNGDTRHYVTTRSPWRDAEGQTIGLIGVLRDVTSRVAAEKALRRSEDGTGCWWRTPPSRSSCIATEHSSTSTRPVPSLLGDGDPAASRERTLWTSCIQRHTRGSRLQSSRDSAANSIQNRTSTRSSRDGSVLDVEALSVLAEHEGREAIQTVLRDVTERRAAEWAVRDREARVRLVMNQIPAVLWATDREARLPPCSVRASTRSGIEARI